MTSYSDQNLRREREYPSVRITLRKLIASIRISLSNSVYLMCLFSSCVGIDCSGRWPTVLCVPPSATTFAGR